MHQEEPLTGIKSRLWKIRRSPTTKTVVRTIKVASVIKGAVDFIVWVCENLPL